MVRRVADIIMDILTEHSITDCFAVVGGGAMHLDNALAINNKINKYFNHHEQACAMAAEAYARTCGKMAAVCVTSGPGATNTLTGVMGAWQDSIPMIVLSGQVRYAISVPKSGLTLRYRGLQEFQIVPTVKNMTKYAVMITDPLSIRSEMEKAIAIAMEGRRGPVWLDIPQDIQNAMVDEDALYPTEKIEAVYQEVDYKELIDRLKEAKRPCILTGTGIRSGNATEEFLQFIESADIPVIEGDFASDTLYNEHPLCFGPAGNIGPRTGNFILQNADLIISLGNSLGFRQTGFNQEGFAPNASIVMVDADENEAKKPGLRISQFIHRDLKTFFEELSAYDLKHGDIAEWMDYCRGLKKRFTPFEAINGLDEDDRVCSYRFWKELADLEPDDSIIAMGVNTACSSKLQIGVNKKEQRMLTNYTCGSMGLDLPEAIGAAVASKKRVFCVTGDGCIMMNLQELQTIRYYDLPISIIVFSNNGYGAIRQTAKNFYNGVCIGCTEETGISFPDFDKLADTFGFEYMRCRKNSELKDCLKAFIDNKNRTLLVIDQRLDDPITPKIMSRIDENGKMLSPALHDMAPFLSKEDMESLMISEVGKK